MCLPEAAPNSGNRVDRPWEKESARCAEQELEQFKHTAPAMAAAGLLVVADDMERYAQN